MKRKYFLFLAALLIIAASNPKQIHASSEKTSRSSATLARQASPPSEVAEIDNRAKILEEYLKKYDSPLAPYAQIFIDQADKYDLDWKLVPAIAGVESYFGHMIPPYSYNGWGFGVYGNNVLRFASWEDGIMTLNKSLRERYMTERGATNIYEIGSTYAADRSWANKVQHFISEIEQVEQGFSSNNTLSISI